jgi:hypothetical protein
MNPARLWIAVCGMVCGLVPASIAAGAANDLSGRVVDAQTGEGVERARVMVQVTPPGSNQPATLVVLTNPDGGFGVRNLPDGACRIWSEKAGYLGGQRSGSQASILFSDADTPAPVILQLTRQAVIEGRVVDQSGAAITASIKLFRLILERKGGVEFQRDMQVDGTGEFRLAGLEAGHYYIEFGGRFDWPNQAKKRAYSIQFYPHAPDLQSAKAIEMQAGQVAQLTLQLQAAPAYEVRGRVPAATQRPAISLHLPGEPDPGMQFFNPSWDERNENFTFSGVPPGVWILEANFSIDGHAVQLSKTVRVADADVDGIALEPAIDSGAPGKP